MPSSWTNNKIYRIFCRDMTNTLEGSGFRQKLGGLFSEVVRRPEMNWGAAICMIYPAKEPPDPHEMIVYLVESRRRSIIRRFDRTVPLGTGGTCRIDPSGNISEVYLDVFLHDPALCIAKLAFHELMHNRLNMDNRLHTDAGFGLASDMDSDVAACAAPFNPFNLNEENKRLMAERLLKPITQRWLTS